MKIIALSNAQLHEFQKKFIAESKMVMSNQFHGKSITYTLGEVARQRQEGTIEPCVAFHILAFIDEEFGEVLSEDKEFKEMLQLALDITREETIYAAAVYYDRKSKVDPSFN